MLFNTHLAIAAPTDFKFIHPSFTNEPTIESEPELSDDLKNQFSNLRIKVFPHNSKYNSPHGIDKITNRLTLSSSGLCQVYRSESESSEAGFTKKYLLKSGSKFEFTTENVPQPLWIECSQAFELVRVDYPAKPIRYPGVLFLKTVTPPTDSVDTSASSPQPYLTAVNVVPFETYLKGVVPSEMPSSWSTEALKAQSIATRTYAYYELGTNVSARDKNLLIEKSGAQIDDTVTYQVYLGLKNTAASTDKAIDETKGLVMTYKNKIIKSYFHADSGGHTENAENVWGVAFPYIIGKAEIYPDGSIPGTQWNLNLKLSDLKDKLLSEKLLDTEDIIDSVFVQAGDYYSSGRPTQVKVKLTNNNLKTIAAVDFSYAARLRSSWFSFTTGTEPQSLTISGQGYGHGAGMNQWGARTMADKLGKKYEDILKFYYTDIQILK